MNIQVRFFLLFSVSFSSSSSCIPIPTADPQPDSPIPIRVIHRLFASNWYFWIDI